MWETHFSSFYFVRGPRKLLLSIREFHSFFSHTEYTQLYLENFYHETQHSVYVATLLCYNLYPLALM